MNDIITKQCEIIENLVKLNQRTLELLAQFTEVEEYEHGLEQILDN